jgi:cytidine deaminase
MGCHGVEAADYTQVAMNGVEHRDAGLVSYVLLAADEVTDEVSVVPCGYCERWQLELYREGDRVMIREWHAEDCRHLAALLAEDELA